MTLHNTEINTRQQNIIRTLLHSPGRITLSELAEKTGLSSRVVRYNMDVVCTWLRCPEVHIINKPGYGIEVVASQQTKDGLLERINGLDDCDIILTRQQRIRIILLYLLTTLEPVAAKEISEVEEFSRSTLFKDIRGVEEWLARYNIRVVRQSARGMWITGKEESRRFALSRVIREELGDARWYRLPQFFQENEKFPVSGISGRFNRFMEKLELQFSRTLIRCIEENIGLSLSVVSQAEMMLYLAVTIHALSEGRTNSGEIEGEMFESQEFAAAQAIAYQIKKRYGLPFPEKEKEIMAALILSSKLDSTRSNGAQDHAELPIASKKSQNLAQELINVCSMRLHPMIKIDDILLNELSNHLDYAIFRLKHHIPIRNANLDILLERYPQVYRVVENSAFILEKEVKRKIPREEIGYIAMYLLSALERLRTEEDSRLTAIIANDGVRSKSSLLKSRLEFEFPNLKVAGVLNTFSSTPIEDYDADVMISTIPMENSILPAIEVNPFLEIEDIKKIQRWIAEKSQAQRHSKLGSFHEFRSLVDLVRLPNIVFMEKADDWQQLVRTASAPLLKSGCIQPRYMDAMIAVIENYGFYMYMGSGVLLLHAKPTDGVNELCISMLKLDFPFHFDDGRVPDVDIVIVLGATDDHSHLTALFQLNELIQFPEFMEGIRSAQEPADIVRTLWKWLPNLPETAS